MADLLNHVGPFMLVLLRISGLFVFAPLLSSASIPGKVRILLAFAMALCIYPVLPRGAVADVGGGGGMDVFSLVLCGVMEILLGTLIGVVAMLPVLAVQLGGTLIGQQMGFGLATVYNPALETESEPLGELLLYLAITAFIAMGGLEMLFLSTANTFVRSPAGAVTVQAMPAELVVGAIGAGVELALRVSAPVLAIILIETIATAFIMKTMPQLNILSIGFAVKISLGLLAIVLGLKAIDRAISTHGEEVGRVLMRWSATPVPPRVLPAG